MLGTERTAGARILSVGGYRPARVVPNDEVCGPIASSDDWIRQRSGIVSRRFAGPDETVLSMATAAAAEAIEAGGVPAARIGAVVLASMSYLRQSPAAAPQVAHAIGARRAAAFDVDAACAGFCYALGVADALVRAGTSEYVLVVGAEKMSDIVDPADRSTAFLFADGAGAVLVGPAAQREIGPVVWGSDGSRHDLIAHSASWLDLRDGGPAWPTLRMAGPEVFRWAIENVPGVARRALAEAGVKARDLVAFVPHQANVRIIDALAKRLELPAGVAIARDVVTSGNTSAASVPLALHRMAATGLLPSGGPALLLGFGGGLTYAAQVVSLPPLAVS
jgi:3-oxoacyl-[acyl-carrier-protein] synthase-3